MQVPSDERHYYHAGMQLNNLLNLRRRRGQSSLWLAAGVMPLTHVTITCHLLAAGHFRMSHM